MEEGCVSSMMAGGYRRRKFRTDGVSEPRLAILTAAEGGRDGSEDIGGSMTRRQVVRGFYFLGWRSQRLGPPPLLGYTTRIRK